MIFIYFIIIAHWRLYDGCILTHCENILNNDKKNAHGYKFNIFIEPFIYFFSEKTVYICFDYMCVLYPIVVVLIALYKINNQ